VSGKWKNWYQNEVDEKKKREVISAGVRTCQYISTCLVFSPVLTLLNEPIPISGAAAGTIAT